MKNTHFSNYLTQKYGIGPEFQKRIAVIDNFESFLSQNNISSIKNASEKEMEEYAQHLLLNSRENIHESAYESFIILGEYGEVTQNEDLMLLMVYFISATGDADAYLTRLKELNLNVWEKISWPRFFGDEL
ncbi:hypothetical protein [Methanolapillus ohkumae]|uniref:Uncharacterized protein n=1 Tax=Methanolapillus ohkumae TaxID=3028298 RepID=A0AA97A524_9EURY|nr:hypothetical protein MsAm2_00030 [Methanosarcinaceae archaeon Am2]